MKMEVLAVQNQYPAHFALATDWKSQLTLSTPIQEGSLKTQPSYKFTSPPLFKPHQHNNHSHYHHNHYYYGNNYNKNNNVTSNKTQLKQQQYKTNTSISSNKLNCDTTTNTTTTTTIITTTNSTTILNTNTNTHTTHNNTTNATLVTSEAVLHTAAVQELSFRLLDELRAAKSQHLACTEVSLPCDLTPRIALDILRLAHEEVNGLRECTIYLEFEDEPSNSRRIATLDLNKQRANSGQAYEIYVTLRQDHRGWTSLLPQFMKNLSRTITISPEFSITKYKPYSKSLC